MSFLSRLVRRRKAEPQPQPLATRGAGPEPLRSVDAPLALEPRLMFDAAAVITAAETLPIHDHDHDAGAVEAPAAEAQVRAVDDATAVGLALTQLNARSAGTDDAAGAAGALSDTVVFVDGRLQDLDALCASWPEGLQVVVFDPAQDGLAQIEAALAGRQDVASLHLITHGSAGSLQLGATLLQPTALDAVQAGQLDAIRAHLAPGVDLFVYGCDFGAGLQGQAAVSALAAALGGDMAASTDATGSATRGGDWTLELRQGPFEHQPLSAEQWDGLLLGVNTPPVAVSDTAMVAEDDSVLIDATANDVDVEGQVLAITSATALSGTVTVQADGRLLYVPTANFFGSDTITYALSDSAGAAAAAPGTVAVTVQPVDDIATLTLPAAGALPLLSEDTPLIFASAAGTAISLGDIDGGLTTLRLSVPVGGLTLAQTAGLTLTEGDGVDDAAITLRGSLADIHVALDGLAYTPGADHNGAVQITFTVGDTLIGLVPVTTVLPLGISAVADIVDDAVVVVAGQSASFNVLANDSFEHSGRVVSGHTLPAHGSLTIDAQGQALYTPDPGWTGSDSFTYTVSSNGTTETATVTLDTQLAPQPPTLGLPPAQTLAEDVTLVFGSAQGRALTVADANGDALTVQLSVSHGTVSLAGSTGLTLLAGDGVDDASLTVSGSAAAINAALDGLRYTPAADHHGAATLTLQASDGSSVQTGSVALQIDSVVDGVADALSTGALQPVSFLPLANDLFEGPASLVSAGPAAHGTVVPGPGGVVTYTPDAGFAGTDVFSYVVSAGGVTETVQVSVQVAPNQVPTAGTLAPLLVTDGLWLSAPVAGAFADADVGDVLGYTASGLPAGLAIDVHTGIISGIVDGHASQVHGGHYTVLITATDREGASVSQTLALTVDNALPQTSLLLRDVAEDGQLTVGLSSLAVDADGDGLSLGSLTALHGTVSLLPDGSLSYVPDADFNGLDEILYGVSDSDGGQANGRIEVTVQARADLPTITLPTLSPLTEDTPLVFASVLGQPIRIGDVDGQVLRLSLSVPVGDLTLAQTAGVSISQGDGVHDGLITLDGTAAQLNAALEGLVWTPGADHNGPVTLTLDLGPLLGPPSVQAQLPLGITAVADIVDDRVSVNAGSAVQFNVLANDSFEHPDRQVSACTLPSHGTLSLDAQGRAVYTPQAGWTGTDSFTYTVSSGGTLETATVTLDVQARPNAAPTGSGLADRSALDGQTLSVDVSAAFADPDGDPLSWQAAGLPAGLSIDPATGVIRGTLDRAASAAGAQGAYPITVTASDGRGGSLTQAFTLQVGNPPPQAQADSAGGAEDQVIDDRLLDNDSDPDGDALRVDTTPVQAPAHGSLTLQADGRFRYTPDPDFHGSDSFSYRVTDADGASAVATVSLQITPVADAPQAVADVAVTAEDTAVTIPVRANDREVDGQALQVVSASAAHGQVQIQSDGTLRYVPDADFHGSDTVYYTVEDADGLRSTAEVGITVQAVNDAPRLAALADRSDQTGTPTSLDVSALASDPDGPALSWSASGLPPGLSLDAASGLLSGTPQVPGEYRVTIEVRDPDGARASASFVWRIDLPPNDSPEATASLAPRQADDGQSLRIETAGAFRDPEGDALSYAASGLPAGLGIDTVTGVISGTLSAGASSAVADGVYTVIVTASDGRGGRVQQGLTITVANLAPLAGDERITVAEDGAFDGQLWVHDRDPDGDALRVETRPVQAPAHGTLSLAADGRYRYVPDPDFSGGDRFIYRLVDADGAAVTATVEITVTASNDAPRSAALLDDRSATPGAPQSLSLVAAFSDPDGDGLVYTASGLPPGLDLDAASGLISGTPTTPGHYPVQVQVSDAAGATARQTFVWTIDGSANNTPGTVGVLAAQTASDGGGFVLATAAAFGDADGDALRHAASGLPAGLSIDAQTGLISGTLDGQASQGGQAGVYTVIVTVDDGRGGTARQGFTLTVGHATPQALDIDLALAEDSAISGQLTDAVRDTLGEVLSLVPGSLEEPLHGRLVVAEDGRWTYTPDADYNGQDSFRFRIVDGGGAAVQAEVRLSVQPVADAPQAQPLPAATGAVGQALVIDTASGFSDADGDVLQFSAEGLPPGVRIDPLTGVIGGLPTQDGRFAVTVIAVDDSGLSGRTTLPLEITGTSAAAGTGSSAVRAFSLADSVDGLRLSGGYDPVLLAAVNEVQRLGGVGDLAVDPSVTGTVSAAGSLGSSVQLGVGAHPMAQVVGDLSAGFKQGLRLEGVDAGRAEGAPGLAVDALRQGSQQQLDRLLTDPAMRDALGVARAESASRPLAALGELPIPLSQQLRQAEAHASAELDALARALG
ncbi:MAG: hypothetical protein RLY78_1886 [Pseudomonadota bacterium]